MKKRRIIVGGNWKMYKTPSQAVAAAKALKVKLINLEHADAVICPPFTDLVPVSQIIRDSKITLGGQNLHWEEEGAFTGEISARMLRDSGCEYVIIGHSERRHVFGEKDQEINKKIKKAFEVGLKPIFCVGETLDQRKAGATEEVVEKQVRSGLEGVKLDRSSDLIVAYEPVWAIGTGENATPDQAEGAQRFIRGVLSDVFGDSMAEEIRIQYGGSVKPANAAELMSQPNVDGALVGGASLDPDSFTAIVKTAERISK